MFVLTSTDSRVSPETLFHGEKVKKLPREDQDEVCFLEVRRTDVLDL